MAPDRKRTASAAGLDADVDSSSASASSSSSSATPSQSMPRLIMLNKPPYGAVCSECLVLQCRHVKKAASAQAQCTPPPYRPCDPHVDVSGISSHGLASLGPSELEIAMHERVSRIATAVSARPEDADARWSAWEEEESRIRGGYFMRFTAVLEAVLEVATAASASLELFRRANECLYVLCESVRLLDFVRARAGVEYFARRPSPLSFRWREPVGWREKRSRTPMAALDWAWRALIRSACGAAERVPEEAVLRFLNDAGRFGCALQLLFEAPEEPSICDAGRERARRLLLKIDPPGPQQEGSVQGARVPEAAEAAGSERSLSRASSAEGGEAAGGAAASSPEMGPVSTPGNFDQELEEDFWDELALGAQPLVDL